MGDTTANVFIRDDGAWRTISTTPAVGTGSPLTETKLGGGVGDLETGILCFNAMSEESNVVTLPVSGKQEKGQKSRYDGKWRGVNRGGRLLHPLHDCWGKHLSLYGCFCHPDVCAFRRSILERCDQPFHTYRSRDLSLVGIACLPERNARVDSGASDGFGSLEQ